MEIGNGEGMEQFLQQHLTADESLLLSPVLQMQRNNSSVSDGSTPPSNTIIINPLESIEEEKGVAAILLDESVFSLALDDETSGEKSSKNCGDDYYLDVKLSEIEVRSFHSQKRFEESHTDEKERAILSAQSEELEDSDITEHMSMSKFHDSGGGIGRSNRGDSDCTCTSLQQQFEEPREAQNEQDDQVDKKNHSYCEDFPVYNPTFVANDSLGETIPSYLSPILNAPEDKKCYLLTAKPTKLEIDVENEPATVVTELQNGSKKLEEDLKQSKYIKDKQKMISLGVMVNDEEKDLCKNMKTTSMSKEGKIEIDRASSVLQAHSDTRQSSCNSSNVYDVVNRSLVNLVKNRELIDKNGKEIENSSDQKQVGSHACRNIETDANEAFGSDSSCSMGPIIYDSEDYVDSVSTSHDVFLHDNILVTDDPCSEKIRTSKGSDSYSSQKLDLDDKTEPYFHNGEKEAVTPYNSRSIRADSDSQTATKARDLHSAQKAVNLNSNALLARLQGEALKRTLSITKRRDSLKAKANKFEPVDVIAQNCRKVSPPCEEQALPQTAPKLRVNRQIIDGLDPYVPFVAKPFSQTDSTGGSVRLSNLQKRPVTVARSPTLGKRRSSIVDARSKLSSVQSIGRNIKTSAAGLPMIKTRSSTVPKSPILGKVPDETNFKSKAYLKIEKQFKNNPLRQIERPKYPERRLSQLLSAVPVLPRPLATPYISSSKLKNKENEWISTTESPKLFGLDIACDTLGQNNENSNPNIFRPIRTTDKLQKRSTLSKNSIIGDLHSTIQAKNRAAFERRRILTERERQKRLIKERRSSLQKLSNQINELRGALK